MREPSCKFGARFLLIRAMRASLPKYAQHSSEIPRFDHWPRRPYHYIGFRHKLAEGTNGAVAQKLGPLSSTPSLSVVRPSCPHSAVVPKSKNPSKGTVEKAISPLGPAALVYQLLGRPYYTSVRLSLSSLLSPLYDYCTAHHIPLPTVSNNNQMRRVVKLLTVDYSSIREVIPHRLITSAALSFRAEVQCPVSCSVVPKLPRGGGGQPTFARDRHTL